MKKLSLVTMFVLISFVLALNPVTANAQDLRKTVVSSKIDPSKLTLIKSTDLSIMAIISYGCQGDMPGIDAFYVGNIMVGVKNAIYNKHGWPTAAVITLKYFDLGKGKLVKIVKTTPKLHVVHGKLRAIADFLMVDHPVLVKKSVGISVCVKPVNSSITDPVPGNNCKTTYKCNQYVK